MFPQGDRGDPGLPGFKGDKVSTARHFYFPGIVYDSLLLQIHRGGCLTLLATLTWDQRFSLVPPTDNQSHYPHAPRPHEAVHVSNSALRHPGYSVLWSLFSITLQRLQSGVLRRRWLNIMERESTLFIPGERIVQQFQYKEDKDQSKNTD